MGKKLNNIHDAYFKAMMEEPEVAMDFVKWVLPAEVLHLLKLSTLRLMKDSFIDNRLSSSFSDALFSVEYSSDIDEKALICILMEHKSSPQKHTSFQTLSYLASAYLSQIKQKNPLSIIIPVVYYHGKENWTLKHPIDFFQNTPEKLRNYIPVFNIEFVDLSNMADKELIALRNSMLYSALSVQRFSHNSPGLIDQLSNIIQTIAGQLSGNFLDQTIVYVLEIIDKEPEFIMKITENIQEPLKEKIMSTYQKFIQKGKLEGKSEIVINLHETGMDIDFIVKVTGLSKKTVEDIIREKEVKER